MGIHKFHSWVKTEYPQVVKKVDSNYKCDHIYIDANHILHIALIKSTSKINFFNHVINSISYILRIFKPVKSVTIALDGVAPYAKIELQKKRRQTFKDIDMNEINSMYLTPGTQFMKDMSTHIQNYLTNREKSRKFNKIIYNLVSSDIPGEGEIKLIKYLKNNHQNGMYDSHLLIGNDADLILIATANNIYNIHVGIHQKGNFTVDVDELLRVHFTKYGNLFSDIHREDFALISLLLGNDYFPKLYGIKLDILWNSYKNIMHTNQIPICSNGIINKNILKSYLKNLSINIVPRYQKITLSSFDTLKCSKYWEGILWCNYMYQNGKCPAQDWTFTFDSGITPFELLMTLELCPNFIINKCNKTNIKPINNELYALLILPKKARILISDKYQHLIDTSLSFLYQEEDCQICCKLKTSLSTLHKLLYNSNKNNKNTDDIKSELSKLNTNLTKHKISHSNLSSISDTIKTITSLLT